MCPHIQTNLWAERARYQKTEYRIHPSVFGVTFISSWTIESCMQYQDSVGHAQHLKRDVNEEQKKTNRIAGKINNCNRAFGAAVSTWAKWKTPFQTILLRTAIIYINSSFLLSTEVWLSYRPTAVWRLKETAAAANVSAASEFFIITSLILQVAYFGPHHSLTVFHTWLLSLLEPGSAYGWYVHCWTPVRIISDRKIRWLLSGQPQF